MSITYLDWLISATPTAWWHDSADPAELDRGIERRCVGVTTNPVLASTALQKNRQLWGDDINAVLAQRLPAEQQAEALMRVAVSRASVKLRPQFEASRGRSGFVCAQVNPLRAGDREAMAAMARRFHAWEPNVAVKLPATAAGLDVLEDCVADGITTTATVSFTVPQAIAIAERHRAGRRRAQDRGIEPGQCFAVIMIGRLDDYLREVAQDGRVEVSEDDIRRGGLAVTKRAYAIYKERGYDAVLLVAALRGPYHLTELAGADLVMSIHPTYQEPFLSRELAHEPRIEQPVAPDVIVRLSRMPDFVRAFEPDGMAAADFMTFGLTQRTLSQFAESWKQMESLR